MYTDPIRGEIRIMKNLITLLVLVLTSISALAVMPSRELSQISRVLVNNPTIVDQLNKNNSAHLADYKITSPKYGVYQYDLVFKRQCLCLPSTALVTVIEDLTPTFADGAIKYQVTVTIKAGN